MARLLLFSLLLVPVLEIYLFIQVGGVIGALPTVGLVLLTAILGILILRHQGLSTLGRVQDSMRRGEIPALQMLEGFILIVAGVLLMVPGFFTDSLGFILMVPWLRRRLLLWVLKNANIIQVWPGPGPRGPGSTSGSPRVIEGEYRRDE